jgi:hypothetical protein
LFARHEIPVRNQLLTLIDSKGRLI